MINKPSFELQNLTKFVGGWVVGNFEPSLFKNSQLEVCIKRFKAGEYEEEHFQLSAHEVTIVLSGTCELAGVTLQSDDILVIPPRLSASFRAISDCTVIGIKWPSVPEDKVLGRSNFE